MSYEDNICPRCFLPELKKEKVLNAVSHDGKTIICSQCGLIESLKAMGVSAQAHGLEVAQRRSQAALYGLDEHRNPKRPPKKKKKKKLSEKEKKLLAEGYEASAEEDLKLANEFVE